MNLTKEEQAARMNADRFVCELIGIRLLDLGAGYAKVALDLKPIHLNGVGLVQGGVLFTMADFAFAAACNYSEENVVGVETSMSYIKSVREGTVYAEAREVSRTRSFTSCDVRVTDDKERLVALFRARGFVLRK